MGELAPYGGQDRVGGAATIPEAGLALNQVTGLPLYHRYRRFSPYQGQEGVIVPGEKKVVENWHLYSPSMGGTCTIPGKGYGKKEGDWHGTRD